MTGFDLDRHSAQEIIAEATRRAARRARGLPITDDDVGLVGRANCARLAPAPAEYVPDDGTRTVRLPWSVLISDNKKPGVGFFNKREYREAKKRAGAIAAEQLQGLVPLHGALVSAARLYEPDRRRKRDLSNLMKLVHDALNGSAYVDDRDIDHVDWDRAGVDIDAPRLEVTITTRRT